MRLLAFGILGATSTWLYSQRDASSITAIFFESSQTGHAQTVCPDVAFAYVLGPCTLVHIQRHILRF